MEKQKGSLVETGVYSAVVGVMAMECVPGMQLLGIGMIAAGVWCMFEYFRHRSRFDKLWRNLKLGMGETFPELKRSNEKDGYTLYEFSLPAGLSVDDVIKKQEAIQQYLGAGVTIEYGFKNMLLKVYTEAEKTRYDYEQTKLKGRVPIMIGYNRQGKLVSADLGDGEPHMYIAGETGSGKSTALRSILVNLILTTDVQLFLGDLKNGVEFNLFKNCSKVKGFAKDEKQMLAMLQDVLDEVERRYNMFSDAEVEDIVSYNRAGNKMQYWLVVIDEFSTLMYEKESMYIVETLAAKARACGIHLLLSTQRPDAKVITGRIKANISNVLGLKTLDATNSQIIIGHPGLEKLRGHGHGLFRRGSSESTIQAPLLSVEDAKRLIAPYNIVKNKSDEPVPDIFDALEALQW